MWTIYLLFGIFFGLMADRITSKFAEPYTNPREPYTGSQLLAWKSYELVQKRFNLYSN